MVTRGNRRTMHGHSQQQVHYAWSLTARGALCMVTHSKRCTMHGHSRQQVHYAWSLAATGALCMVTRGNRTLCVVTRGNRCTMRGHSRQKVHYACSIGRHTHKTTVDAGVTDDSHSAYSSRVTGVGRAGDCACDHHVTTK